MVRKLALAVALALGSASFTVSALGLGELKARSHLNQAFDADIDLLSVDANELDAVKVKLASPEAFVRAGVDRSYALSQLRFTPELNSAGRTVIRVTSDFPIQEPFLNFLIEVNWPRGRLVREYTVLLDPPTTTRRSAPRVAAPVASQPQIGRPQGAAARPAPSRTTPLTEYGPVRRNETLWGIAKQLRPTGVSMNQMMMSLFEANPQAFVDDNVNKLRRGQILRVPARAEILRLSRAQANAMFQAQQDSWLAERGVASSTDQLVEAPQPQGEAAQPPSGETTDRLRIASTDPELVQEAGAVETDTARDPSVEDLNNQILLAREEAETSRQDAELLRERVESLRAQLEDMQRLLTLKDDQLARIQGSVTPQPQPEGTLTTAPDVAPPDDVVAPLGDSEYEGQLASAPGEAVEGLEDFKFDEDPTVTATPFPVDQTDAATMSPTGDSTVAMDGGEVPAVPFDPQTGILIDDVTAEILVDTPITEAVEDPMVTGEPGLTPELVEPVPQPAAVPGEQAEIAEPVDGADQPAWMAKLEQLIKVKPDMPVLIGLGAGIVLLGSLVGIVVGRRGRKRKAAVDSGTQDPVIAAPPAEGPMPDDDHAASILSELSPQELEGLQEDAENVDPISEADVYIAYGRYQQAEKLLREAIEKEPQRSALPHKLLEVYYAMRNPSAFVSLAGEMMADGRDQADPTAWERAKEMGRELDGDNVMFTAVAGAAPAASTVTELRPAETQEQGNDESLELDETELSELARDLEQEFESELAEGPQDTPEDLSLELHEAVDQFSAQVDQESVPMEELESMNIDLPTVEAVDPQDVEQEVISLDEMALAGQVDEELGAGDSQVLDDGDLGRDSVLKIDTEIDQAELESQLSELSELTASTDSIARAADSVELETPLDLENAFDQAAADVDEDLGTLEIYDGESSGVAGEDEVETKLDLARAYVEMGDSDGARSILEEVQGEGNDDQKAEAGKLLLQLAS